MNQYFLQANYRVLPDFSEIREHENRLTENPKNDGFIRSFPHEYHHEIFEAQGIVIYRDNRWETISTDDFNDIFDSTEEYPVGYVESTGVLGLGMWSKPKGGRSEPNWKLWLYNENSYKEWEPVLLEATKYFSDNLTQEYFFSCLYELVWYPSVDWETGIDEGNFEISRTIFGVPKTDGDVPPIYPNKIKYSGEDLLTFAKIGI